MHRVLAAALLAGGLLAGYAAGGNRMEAQALPIGSMSANFPFPIGDTVRLQRVVDPPAGNPSCVIENFSGSFVVCKSENDMPFAFNLEKVIKVTRIARGQR